jgi:hypothetical protein
MISEAADLGAGLAPSLSKAYQRTYSVLADELGCAVYVKTIYVGFSISGEMVAAVYPHKDNLEIALALPEDIEGSEFKDATHLTWPTMPVCVEVRTSDDLAVGLDHIRAAAARVRDGDHDVRRPNEHFIGRVRRLTTDPTKPVP